MIYEMRKRGERKRAEDIISLPSFALHAGFFFCFLSSFFALGDFIHLYNCGYDVVLELS